MKNKRKRDYETNLENKVEQYDRHPHEESHSARGKIKHESVKPFAKGKSQLRFMSR